MNPSHKELRRVVRVANGQGFWGDDREAPVRQIEGGAIDYLTLDYLAEVTMSIMRRMKDRNPDTGYATDFVPLMERIFPECASRGVTVIANAGGVNPAGCARAVADAAARAGTRARVALVRGDDIADRLEEITSSGHTLSHMENGEPLTTVLDRVRCANVYLGAAPVVEALARLDAQRDASREGAASKAKVVVTGRVADASLTVAPLVHEFGWSMRRFDLLGAATVAGHVLECGAQSTGGNCMHTWWEIPDLAAVGFPIVEAGADGGITVTKHVGSGGRVDRATVTEQILYEIGDPAAYATPDVIADFTGLSLESDGPDRVRVRGAGGRPRPERLKVSIGVASGWRATGTMTYAWPDAALKARAAARLLGRRLDRLGLGFNETRAELVGWDSALGPLAGPPPPDLPEVELRFGVRSESRAAVERFSREIAPLVLTGPPSATGYLGGRPRVQEVIAFWPALIDRDMVEPFVTVDVVEV